MAKFHQIDKMAVDDLLVSVSQVEHTVVVELMSSHNILAKLHQIDKMVLDELLVSVSLVEHTCLVVELVWVPKSQNNSARLLQIGKSVMDGLALRVVVPVSLVVERKSSQNSWAILPQIDKKEVNELVSDCIEENIHQIHTVVELIFSDCNEAKLHQIHTLVEHKMAKQLHCYILVYLL